MVRKSEAPRGGDREALLGMIHLPKELLQMAQRSSKKIFATSANCNSPSDKAAENREKRSQAQLGIALARPNLIPGQLTHISVPLRKILARVASKVRGGE